MAPSQDHVTDVLTGTVTDDGMNCSTAIVLLPGSLMPACTWIFVGAGADEDDEDELLAAGLESELHAAANRATATSTNHIRPARMTSLLRVTERGMFHALQRRSSTATRCRAR